MAYLTVNFPTKAAARRAILAGQRLALCSYPAYTPRPARGRPGVADVAVEGPWFPQPHTWYGTVQVVDGTVVAIK